jgi:hypothetical protein
MNILTPARCSFSRKDGAQPVFRQQSDWPRTERVAFQAPMGLTQLPSQRVARDCETQRPGLPTTTHLHLKPLSTVSLYLPPCLCIAFVWLRTGRPGDRGSISGRGKRLFICAQTGSGGYPASCTMGIGSPFSGSKARPGREPHLVPRTCMSRSYTSSPPKRLHGV